MHQGTKHIHLFDIVKLMDLLLEEALNGVDYGKFEYLFGVIELIFVCF